MGDDRRPDKRLAVLLTAAGLLATVVFCIWIRADKESIRKADVSKLTEETDVTAGIEEIVQGEYIQVEGYAYIEGESIHEVNQHVLLYDRQENAYWQIPTQMDVEEEHNEVEEGGKNYEKGGFLAKVKTASLEPDLSEYEICIAYQNDGHRVLVHTGVLLN